MEPATSTSVENNNTSCKGRKQLEGKTKEIVTNVYNYLIKAMPEPMALDRCESMTGISSSMVYRLVKGRELPGNVQAPKVDLRGRKLMELEEDHKLAVWRMVHSFYFNNEIPTLEGVFAKIQGTETIPQMSRKTLRRLLHKLNFRYVKHNRKSAVIEKSEVVTWRHSYLRSIAEFRKQNRKIYYLDETWVSAGHMAGKQDTTSVRAGKEHRLIVMHIGSDDGFLKDSSLIFSSKKTGDNQEDINADRFEQWFESVLNHVPDKSVIIMDNAPCHSRRSERIPTIKSPKDEMQQWLREKGIAYDDSAVKAELISLIKQHRSKYMQYVVDDMARRRGINILRLPPYHELNPIELIWVQVKEYVARHNVTFKLADVEGLLDVALKEVTPLAWQIAINRILQEEQRMWQLDVNSDILVDPLVIHLHADESNDSDSSVSSREADLAI